jgi:hypothetical protein
LEPRFNDLSSARTLWLSTSDSDEVAIAIPGDRGAFRRIAHPGWDLSGKVRAHLDISNLPTSTALSAINTNALTVKRMPGVGYDNKCDRYAE